MVNPHKKTTNAPNCRVPNSSRAEGVGEAGHRGQQGSLDAPAQQNH